MKKEYSLKHERHEFLFALEHQNYKAETPGGEVFFESPYIYCKLYRADIPLFYWDWQGYLLPNEKIEFHLIYDDEVNIRGQISLFHSPKTGNNFIFMDAFFGIRYEEHFEGNILEIGKDPIPPSPIPPDPDPGPDPLPVPPDVIISSGGYRDLFPYLYMQYWPSVQPDDQLFLVPFPYYSGGTPFYSTLLTLSKGTDARQNMESEALKYINGEAPYQGCFITSIEELTYPLNIYPDIYNDIYVEELLNGDEIIIRLSGSKSANEAELDMNSTYPEQIMRVWENILALNIITGYEPLKSDQLTKILLVDAIVQYMAHPPAQVPANWLYKLIHASLILPDTLFPLPSYGAPPSPAPPIYTGSIVPYAIGDLQMVQHKLKGYGLGDIAKIENVMAGELKRTIHRKKELVKQSTSTHQAHSSRKKSADEGELFEKQVYKNLIESLVDTYDYSSLTVSYGPPTTGTYGGSVTTSKDKNKLVQSPVEFAKKILNKTLIHLDEKILERREHLVKNETEECIAHAIDNRKGKTNIKGVYYWLNKIYELKLVNYGHRFMMEFVIEKPVLTLQDQLQEAFLLPPVPPALLADPVKSYNDITEKNYLELGRQYGVYTLPFPPAPNKMVSGKLSGEEYRLTTELSVPDGYLPKTLTYNCSFPTATPAITATLIAGEVQVTVTSAAPPVAIDDPLQLKLIQVAPEDLVVPVLLEISSPPVSFTVPVTTSPPPSPALAPLTCPTLPTVYLSLTLLCTCSDQLTDAWKQQVFLMIQEGYESCVKKYQQQLHIQNRANPNRMDMQVQKMVGNSCRDILWQQHILKNGEPSQPTNPSENTVNKPGYYQFFNEAFEWNKMIYTLDASRSQPITEGLEEELEDTLNNDKLTRFLCSPEVKVLVPLNPAYHYRMLYYLTTGLVAYGQDYLVPSFVTDETLIVKLKKTFDLLPEFNEIEIEKWDLSVPTEMQWLADSTQFPGITYIGEI